MKLPPTCFAAALLALSGCADAPKPIAQAAPAIPPKPAASADQGTIVAVRAVPVAPSETAPILRIATADTARTASPISEFIVRLADGTLVSVVQPSSTTLRPGEAVSVRRATPARIAALPQVHRN